MKKKLMAAIRRGDTTFIEKLDVTDPQRTLKIWKTKNFQPIREVLWSECRDNIKIGMITALMGKFGQFLFKYKDAYGNNALHVAYSNKNDTKGTAEFIQEKAASLALEGNNDGLTPVYFMAYSDAMPVEVPKHWNAINAEDVSVVEKASGYCPSSSSCTVS